MKEQSPSLRQALSLLSDLGPKFLDSSNASNSKSDETVRSSFLNLYYYLSFILYLFQDIFSYQNLMNMAFKVILAFFNTSSIEKADTFPTQVSK